jgi:hypothetical protein
MLHSIKQLRGTKLGASDGVIGQLKDFYFDDRNWVVRYLVVDTGNWLPGRKVLLTPHALDRLDPAGTLLSVRLTRRQIEDSPSIESHKPVSRQYEEEYYRYYGWPFYWQGNALWGMSGFPILDLPPSPAPVGPGALIGPQPEHTDAHLRSTEAVNGYHLCTSDGIIGHICDFMMDSPSWAISQLVIKTGHRFSGKEVLLPTTDVTRISYEESTVFVALPGESVERKPAHPPATAVAAP